MNACYSINKKAGYVTIYNTSIQYPLDLWNEYKTDHDFTHQELANHLLKMDTEECTNTDHSH